MMKMYEIIADYRPNNPNKPRYYVWADTAKDARMIFTNIISWLKIYSVGVVGDDIATKINEHPSHHIIIGDNK